MPLPSLRSFLVGLTILALAAGAYVVALETSAFAVGSLDVVGGSPLVRAEVRRALQPELGRSLLRIDADAVSARATRLPDVVSIRLNREFPHTLRVVVRAERPVLLVRQGRFSWVVSARGRVMRALRDPSHSKLPRLWLKKAVKVRVGESLPAKVGGVAAAAVAPIGRQRFPSPVTSVLSTPGELTLVLKSGFQVRLGDIGDLGLKLAIGRRVMGIAALHTDTAAAKYVDVSVPGRPVLGGLDPQVAGTG